MPGLGAGGFSAAEADLLYCFLLVEVSVTEADHVGQYKGHDDGGRDDGVQVGVVLGGDVAGDEQNHGPVEAEDHESLVEPANQESSHG